LEDEMMRGVVGFSVWNIIVIGVIAVAAVYLYDQYISGKTVFGFAFGRA